MDMVLKKIGIQQGKFCSHSFQIGAASTAAALGYHNRIIWCVGHWTSDKFKAY
ncbi:hypothetical protein JRQ81_000589, partial [Phrynocephalus forsythii]